MADPAAAAASEMDATKFDWVRIVEPNGLHRYQGFGLAWAVKVPHSELQNPLAGASKSDPSSAFEVDLVTIDGIPDRAPETAKGTVRLQKRQQRSLRRLLSWVLPQLDHLVQQNPFTNQTIDRIGHVALYAREVCETASLNVLACIFTNFEALAADYMLLLQMDLVEFVTLLRYCPAFHYEDDLKTIRKREIQRLSRLKSQREKQEQRGNPILRSSSPLRAQFAAPADGDTESWGASLDGLGVSAEGDSTSESVEPNQIVDFLKRCFRNDIVYCLEVARAHIKVKALEIFKSKNDEALIGQAQGPNDDAFIESATEVTYTFTDDSQDDGPSATDPAPENQAGSTNNSGVEV